MPRGPQDEKPCTIFAPTLMRISSRTATNVNLDSLQRYGDGVLRRTPLHIPPRAITNPRIDSIHKQKPSTPDPSPFLRRRYPPQAISEVIYGVHHPGRHPIPNTISSTSKPSRLSAPNSHTFTTDGGRGSQTPLHPHEPPRPPSQAYTP